MIIMFAVLLLLVYQVGKDVARTETIAKMGGEIVNAATLPPADGERGTHGTPA
jgi:hypothetical protein